MLLPKRALAAFAFATLCGGASAQIVFTDVTISGGLGTSFFDAKTNHGLGGAWIDVDKDGWPDLFTVNGKGLPPHLFMNDGTGVLVKRDDLLPVLPNVEMAGAVFADYDNDGDSDIYIVCDNEYQSLSNLPIPNPQDGPPNLLLKNLWVELGKVLPAPGQPIFQEVAAAAGVDDKPATPFPSTTGSNYTGYRAITASWLDIDRDGWVDLYVGHWSCHNQGSPSNWDRIFRNKGDGTFEDWTLALGMPGPTDVNYLRPNLTTVGAHLDQDLWPDLYTGQILCSGSLPAPLHQDYIWRNNGTAGFIDSTTDSPGVGDDSEAAMGIAIGDPDNDGDWDVYIADLYQTTKDALPRGNPLYWNQGDGTFQDNDAIAAGVAGGDSWSPNFLDADNDGFQDLFVATMGFIAGKNFMYANNGNGTFTDVTATANCGTLINKGARGSSVVDIDRDGDLDILVNYDGGQLAQLLRNDSAPSNHWLVLELNATVSNRDAIGAVAKISAGGKNMMRQVMGGTGAHSQDGLALHFGLGTATVVDSINVFWPSGEVSYLENVAADQYVQVTESVQKISLFGAACSGGSDYAPSLLLGGDMSPGGTIELGVQSAYGGGGLIFLIGATQTTATAVGCPLHVQPLLAVFVGNVPGVAAAGRGGLSFPVLIPVSTAPGNVVIQAFITDPGIPTTVSATNGAKLQISP